MYDFILTNTTIHDDVAARLGAITQKSEKKPGHYKDIGRIAGKAGANEAIHGITAIRDMARLNVPTPRKRHADFFIGQIIDAQKSNKQASTVAGHGLLALYTLAAYEKIELINGLELEAINIDGALLAEQALVYFAKNPAPAAQYDGEECAQELSPEQEASRFLAIIHANGYIDTDQTLAGYKALVEKSETKPPLYHEFFFRDYDHLSSEKIGAFLDSIGRDDPKLMNQTLAPVFDAARKRMADCPVKSIFTAAETMSISSWIAHIDSPWAVRTLEDMDAQFGDQHDLNTLKLLEIPFNNDKPHSPATMRAAVHVARRVMANRLEGDEGKKFITKFGLLAKIADMGPSLAEAADEAELESLCNASTSLASDLFETKALYPFLHQLSGNTPSVAIVKETTAGEGSSEWFDIQIARLKDVFASIESAGLVYRDENAAPLTDLFDKALGYVKNIMEIENEMGETLGAENGFTAPSV